MEIIQTGIPGLIEIQPRLFLDERGHFCELYNRERYREIGILNDFCQENLSQSTYGVIRGLHFQLNPYSQAKLATCMLGRVFDVAVDLRKGSPTYRQWRGVVLDAEKRNEFLIPQGFAHGLSVLSDVAVFSYRCDNLYHPKAEGGIVYNDPDLNIDWMIPVDKQIVSEKDCHRTLLKDIKTNFVF
ncbi:MAG: dTDP-4-dehydrorhamnose 3,5-epimerase [Prevotellaceae bacterium]|nr:dTDP-4-dehydrorhamnose 3,5-epimerase [Candidatus Faecinaster equi]